MMEIGNFCKDPPGKNPQCEDEERAHMGLWCMMSSPLVLGFNMSNKDDMDRVWPTITNREAIAVDHAWAGSPGGLHKTLSSTENSTDNAIEVWAKPLPQNQVAILVLNTGVGNVSVSVSLADDVPGGVGQAQSYRSVWDHKDVAIAGGKMALSLPPHGNVFAVLNGTASPAAPALKADDGEDELSRRELRLRERELDLRERELVRPFLLPLAQASSAQ